VYARSPHKKRLLAVMGRVVKFFEEEHAEVFDLDAPTPSKRRPAKSDLLFQFRITLLDIQPAIWRRIQIRDCTLVDLHEYIQAAFGWWNYHLHQFEIDGVTYSQPAPDGDDFGMEFEDETGVLLSNPQSAAQHHSDHVRRHGLYWSDLGCYGGEIDTTRISTPWPAHGVRLHAVLQHGPLLPDARDALLTGLYRIRRASDT
jgi:hypothetical protein